MIRTKDRPFRLGIVEGFFGIPWSWEARLAYVDFLKNYRFDSFLYAPKSDSYLRKHWQEDFPDEHLKRLTALADACHQAELNFGIGLSPFELYRDFSAAKKDLLRRKLDQINTIKPATLCILFDDMRGELGDLAERQGDIMHFVQEHSHAGQFMLCPTYYSDDPALLRHFGKKPENYLETLGNRIDPAVDIFWTGPKVFSESYPDYHLRDIAARLQRPPLIWDNYPVNDAERLTDFLHLDPFPDNSTAIAQHCAGHFANPMNQAFLSQIPLVSLASYYHGRKRSDPTKDACRDLCSPALAAALLEDRTLFGKTGLKGIDNDNKSLLLNKYRTLVDEPIAREVIDWLEGRYAFDPACLT